MSIRLNRIKEYEILLSTQKHEETIATKACYHEYLIFQ
jgi:hypothetical protein